MGRIALGVILPRRWCDQAAGGSAGRGRAGGTGSRRATGVGRVGNSNGKKRVVRTVRSGSSASSQGRDRVARWSGCGISRAAGSEASRRRGPRVRRTGLQSRPAGRGGSRRVVAAAVAVAVGSGGRLEYQPGESAGGALLPEVGLWWRAGGRRQTRRMARSPSRDHRPRTLGARTGAHPVGRRRSARAGRPFAITLCRFGRGRTFGGSRTSCALPRAGTGCAVARSARQLAIFKAAALAQKAKSRARRAAHAP